MDQKYLSSSLQDITFYFLKNVDKLLNKQNDLSFILKIHDKGINFKYVSLEIYKNKNIIHTIKLPEFIDMDKEEYAIEINLYLIKLYETIKIHIQEVQYLHVCPECKNIHANNSIYFSRNYLCSLCLNLKNNQPIKNTDNSRTGHIYFFESALTGLIKIGYSGNLRRRKKEVESLQGGVINILKTIFTIQKYEKYIHERFLHLKVQGEWFRPDKELIDYIKNIQNEADIIK